MVAGAHLCVAHPVLVPFSGISAASMGMSGVELFSVPRLALQSVCVSFAPYSFALLFSLCTGVFGF